MDTLPPVEAWSPLTPQEVAHLLDGIEAWCVVGGWALDLFLGRQTRPHADIEIAVPRSFFAPLRARLGQRFVLYAAGGGTMRRLTPADPFPRDKRQCWVLDEAATAWRLDVMQEPGDAGLWVFRRNEVLTAPRVQLTYRTAEGVPYLAPEAVLLFKAKAPRAKDEADFDTVAPTLSAPARTWLADALALTQPAHPWLARL